MPIRTVASGFVEMLQMVEDEKAQAKEFLRLTKAMVEFLATEEFEQVESLLEERAAHMKRSDELKSEVDLLYISLRSSLSDQGRAAFGAGKEEVAGIWREARDRDRLLAEAMHNLLVDLRQKIDDVHRSKQGHKAYATAEKKVAPAGVDKVN
ncbi:MAG: hypothetical protein KGZ50_11590 [Peptococcaceae bacterium]|nr:hypothetical protein [Peptococcaceae bacterium]